jgi:hypothetical protein
MIRPEDLEDAFNGYSSFCGSRRFVAPGGAGRHRRTSQMNADLMTDLLAMFRRRGYTFVTLDHALADSWIHRWAVAKGIKTTPEPDPPSWVQKRYAAASQ